MLSIVGARAVVVGYACVTVRGGPVWGVLSVAWGGHIGWSVGVSGGDLLCMTWSVYCVYRCGLSFLEPVCSSIQR